MAYHKTIVNEVIMLLAKNVPATKISKEYHINRKTIGIWKKKYKEELALDRAIVRYSEKITWLMLRNKLDEALEKCSNPKFQNEPIIQSQKIRILLRLKKIDEALNICRKAEFSNIAIIQSQRIHLLIEKGDQSSLLEALKICENPLFMNNVRIQSQHIRILMKNGDKESLIKAYNISENRAFYSDFVIEDLRQEIFGKIERLKTLEERQENPQNLEDEHSEYKILLDKIAGEEIDLESIKELIECSNIKEWQKVILLVAYYDKNNYPINIVMNYLKRQLSIYSYNEDILKIIKILLGKMKNKKRIFDQEFYKELLSREIEEKNILEEKVHLQDLSSNINFLSQRGR